jgi:hypothetical protein
MKAKANAKQKRLAEGQKRKELWAPKKAAQAKDVPPAPLRPAVRRMEDYPQQSPEEETREFLEYLEKYGDTIRKDDTLPVKRKGKTGAGAGVLNLEEGMPTVAEAVSRMHIGLQEMKAGRVKAVKLIHGYGSTGRGGKICAGVRQELADMKRKKLVRDFIPGEDFGPTDAASRKAVELDGGLARDPDYGRMNHGITIVLF